MNNDFSIADVWTGEPDLAGIASWAGRLGQRLNRPVTLVLVFMSPRYFEVSADLVRCIRSALGNPILVGCSSNSLISGERECEDSPGIALGCFHLPDADLSVTHFNQNQVEEWNGAGYWRLETGHQPGEFNGWLAFADPFSLDAERWLKQWDDAFSGLPIFGGLASGDYAARRTQLYLNDAVYEEGGVAVAFGGDIGLCGVISQGCTPIGDTWTVTKTSGNVIVEIGNRPAYQVLVETLAAMPADQQQKTRGNLFVGLVMDESLSEFERGDFLIRNILEADAASGVIAIGAIPRPGQTIQFQRRDADASREDMMVLLRRAQNQLAGRLVFGGCLCSCNGRGERLFGPVHHDARQVQDAFGPMGLVGFFCNGEIGPVSGRNFLHGYTASLALFVRTSGSQES